MTTTSEDKRLSYSSATLISSCEQKYWHKKIGNTPIDEDAEESTEAFDIGKSFHEFLEITNHTWIPVPSTLTELGYSVGNSSEELVMAICKKYGVEDKKALIMAMVTKYLKMHYQSGLRTIKCELPISTENTVGYVDAIMVDDNTNTWWIIDLKTASSVDANLEGKLPLDYQLNLYSYWLNKSGVSMLGVPSHYEFGGCRYRVTTKSRLKSKVGESYETALNRYLGSIESVDFIVRAKYLNPEKIFETHLENHERMMQLRQGENPRKNYSACFSYFRPCEFFSKCHGNTFTGSKKLIIRKDEISYKRESEETFL